MQQRDQIVGMLHLQCPCPGFEFDFSLTWYGFLFLSNFGVWHNNDL